METAKAISNLSFDIGDFKFIFRAGVWKPRTSPNTFQGAGEAALGWLQEVKAQFGIPVATEVATPEHVEAALRAGIDYLWIGARSSATPIVVQSLADALGAQNTEHRTQTGLQGVLIKNPVNADAALWLGNIERIEKAVYGVGCKVYAIHRGCNHQPCWAMAHAVRTARPDIPMLLDPSHMSGEAEKVPELMGKIAELGLDGAMVEVHTHPEAALSDRKQQIRPDELRIQNTEHRTQTDHVCTLSAEGGLYSVSDVVELNWLRAEIDELDEQLWDTIAARMDVSRRIGEWKKAHGVAPLQPERYQEIVKRIQNTDRFTDRAQIDFALRLYDLIHKESLNQQV